MSAFEVTTPDRETMLRAMALDSWLDVGDPLAEPVVAALRTQPGALADPLPAIRRLAENGDSACIAFLRDIESPPAWVDFSRMRIGGKMGYRYFPHYIVAITHGGLMTTFCSADAAYLLTRTNRLERNVVRRMFESAEMFFGVLDTEELRPGGTVWETCVRVRLMHTMVRLGVSRSGVWPLPGKPINALNTAAGPVFFGSMILDRLRSLGAAISPDEADGYYLIWRYVTRLLGVPPELLGNTAAEQRALDERILPLAFNPDDNSRRLAAALITGLTHMPGAERLPRRAHEVVVRRMLGDERADAMGIPLHPIGVRIASGASWVLRPYGWAQNLPMARTAAERIGQRTARNLLVRGLDGVRPDYRA